MAVGFKVKYYWYHVGSGDFLHAFFSTICYRLEKNQWGSKYPYLMNKLYQGGLESNNIDNAIIELKDIKIKLKNFQPFNVVWDIDDLSKQPPWGNNISTDITDLSNYFVTSEGYDLIDLLEKALIKAKKLNESIYIDTL